MTSEDRQNPSVDRTSFQFDCWVESRAIAELPPVLRGSVRDLLNGSHAYIADLNDLDAFIHTSLLTHGLPAAGWHGQPWEGPT